MLFDVGKTDPIERGLRLIIVFIFFRIICWKNRPDRKGIKTAVWPQCKAQACVGKTDPIERGLRLGNLQTIPPRIKGVRVIDFLPPAVIKGVRVIDFPFLLR